MLFNRNPELRLRAADTARRISEKAPKLLAPYSTALIDALEELPLDQRRARWHLALASARAAPISSIRLRLAPTLAQWTSDESNEIRCCALEGLGELAMHERSLRTSVRLLVEALFDSGATPALACRARRVLRLLAQCEQREQSILSRAPSARL